MGQLLNFLERRNVQVNEDIEERANSVQPSLEGGDAFSLIAKALTGQQEEVGVRVTEENIMTIPTVSNCVYLIADAIAQLPVYICYYNEDGSVSRVADDIRNYLLNNEPNESIDHSLLKKMMVKDYLINGNAYVVVERKGNEVSGLYPVKASDVSVETFEDGYKTTAKMTVKGLVKVEPENMVTILKDSTNGFEGEGVLTTGKELLKLALEEIYYSQSILENGAIPTGTITVPGNLTPQAFTNIKRSWQRNFGGVKNAGKTAILEGGAKYESISLKPNDLDLYNSKKNTVTEICKLFSVPESMVNANANKYASTESNGLQFLQFCVGPVIAAIESAFNKTLLLEDEKLQGYFFQFDTSELTRTVESEKVETLAKAVKGKLISINEARGKLGYPSMPKDWWIYGLGDVLYNVKTNKLVVANSGLGIDPEKALSPEEMEMLRQKAKIKVAMIQDDDNENDNQNQEEDTNEDVDTSQEKGTDKKGEGGE